MTKVLNRAVIQQIVAATTPSEGHAGLLEALQGHYPDHPFEMVTPRVDYGGSMEAGLVDKNCKRRAEASSLWMRDEFEAAGENARKVWEKHKNSGLILTEWRCSTIFFTIPFGPAPQDFFQMEVQLRKEVTSHQAFDAECPEDFSDLRRGSCYGVKERVITPARYLFVKLVNLRVWVRNMKESEMVRRQRELPELAAKVVCVQTFVPGQGMLAPQDVPFLEMFPDWFTHPAPEIRFLEDWQNSSAGTTGHKLCRHWLLRTSEYEGMMSFTPQWVEADGGTALPSIAATDHESIHGLVSALKDFDQRIGHPFGWFFYLLHGNRICCDAGLRMAQGLRDKLLRLPAADEKILLRWAKNMYGF